MPALMTMEYEVLSVNTPQPGESGYALLARIDERTKNIEKSFDDLKREIKDRIDGQDKRIDELAKRFGARLDRIERQESYQSGKQAGIAVAVTAGMAAARWAYEVFLSHK